MSPPPRLADSPALRELVTASRARQGLPAQVADPAVLRRLAALLAGPARMLKAGGLTAPATVLSPAWPGSSAASPAGGLGRHGRRSAA